MLSHPLCIIALVGHYPTNKLVQRSPLPRRNHTFDPEILSGITHSFPWLFRSSGYVTTRYSPFRRSQPHYVLLNTVSISLDLHA